jgi:hypothetical protein
VSGGRDVGQLRKQSPEMFNGRGVRITTAPCQTLPLDMDETTLDDRLRPHGLNHGLYGLESINGDTVGIKSGSAKLVAQCYHTPFSFFDLVKPHDQTTSLGISDADQGQPSRLKVRAINHQMLEALQITLGGRRASQPVIDEPS